MSSAADGLRHEPLRRAKGLPNAIGSHPAARPLLFASSSANSSLLNAAVRPEPADSSYSDSCYSSEHEVLSREPSDSASLIDQTAVDLSAKCVLSNEESLLFSSLSEFAQKLGYSDEHLQLVLEKLGPNAEQNGVLAELIKLGKKPPSRSTARSNRRNSTKPPPTVTFNSAAPMASERQLRPIVIDGSNIAMTHGRKTVFSCHGVRDCVDFFVRRGHSEIFVFVPKFYQETPRPDTPIADQHLLFELENEGRLIWTPSRRVNGRRIVCHDDRYILSTAYEKNAVIVSNDEFRDCLREHPEYKPMLAQRLLMYSFVDGKFVPPEDPLGRHGPKLDRFLEIRPHFGLQPCPYAKKCTYGNKCKFYHPERNGQHLSATERLMHQNAQKQTLAARASIGAEINSYHAPPTSHSNLLMSGDPHARVIRTQSATGALNGPFFATNQQFSPPQPPSHLLPVPLGYEPPHALHHPQLNRHTSAPLRVTNNVHEQTSGLPSLFSDWTPAADVRAYSALNLHQQPVESSVWSAESFAPSRSIWSDGEFSFGTPRPLETPVQSNSEERQRLQHNLSQIFPPSSVAAVLNAHPNETNAQRLCQRILAYQSGFES